MACTTFEHTLLPTYIISNTHNFEYRLFRTDFISNRGLNNGDISTDALPDNNGIAEYALFKMWQILCEESWRYIKLATGEIIRKVNA